MKLICTNCGFKTTDDTCYTICPTCHEYLDIDESLEAHRIEAMEQDIEEFGNDKIWDIISKHFKGAYQLIEREIFFKAGGVVPVIDLKRELKKEGIML